MWDWRSKIPVRKALEQPAKRLLIATALWAVFFTGPFWAEPPSAKPPPTRPRLVIADFQFAGSGTKQSERMLSGVSLAHLMHIALIPYENKIDIVPRGALWRAFQETGLPLKPEMLFSPEILDAVNADYVYRGRYVVLADTILIEGEIVPRRAEPGRPITPISVPPLTIEATSTAILSRSEKVARVLVDTLMQALTKESDRTRPVEIQTVLSGCFLDADNSNIAASKHLTRNLADSLNHKFRKHPSIAILSIKDYQADCVRKPEPKALMRAYGANGVLSGTFTVNDDKDEVSVLPVLHLRGPEGKKEVGAIRIDFAKYISRGEEYEKFLDRLVEVLYGYIDGVIERTGRPTKDIATAQEVIKRAVALHTRSGREALEEARSLRKKGDTGLAIVVLRTLADSPPDEGVDPRDRANAHYQLGVIEYERGNTKQSDERLRKARRILGKDIAEGEDEALYFDVVKQLADNSLKQGRVREAIELHRVLIRHPVLQIAVDERMAKNLSIENRERFGSLSKFIEDILSLFVAFDETDEVDKTITLLKAMDADLVEPYRKYVAALVRKAINHLRARRDNQAMATADNIEEIEKNIPDNARTGIHYRIRRSVYVRRLAAAMNRGSSWVELRELRRKFEQSTRAYIDKEKSSLPSLFSLDLIENLIIDEQWAQAKAAIQTYMNILKRYPNQDEIADRKLFTQFLLVVLRVVSQQDYLKETKAFLDLIERTRRPFLRWDFNFLRHYIQKGSSNRTFKKDEKHIILEMIKKLSS